MEEVGIGSDEDWLGKTGTEMGLWEDTPGSGESDALRVERCRGDLHRASDACGEERGACDEGQGQEPGSSDSSQGDSEPKGRHLSQGMGTE